MRNRGFTLVELLIVIIVVAVLMAIAIPKTNERWRLAEENRMRIQLKLRREAIERFRADTGLWPADHSDTEDLTAPPTGLNDSGASVTLNARTWRGPYLDNRLFAERNRHPRYRSTFVLYTTTPPGVGRLRWNTTQTSLNGQNIGAW